jgi:hypothetical protein
MVYMGGPKIFNFIEVEMLKPEQTIYIKIQLNEIYKMVPISTINTHSEKMVQKPSSFFE